MTERVLAGRYRLLSPIGRGGMGVVWWARDETLHRDVAVKEVLLAGDLPESERSELYGRAIREARAAALLDHPGIITVHDVITEDDRPWIVMELVAGRSLARAAPLPPHAVAAIGLRVLEALRAAHRRGVLHRDVKPTNILLADDGRVVLTDFGIASLEGDPSLTRTGGFVGSPGFVAPERLRERAVGPSSDLWSLGATLYTAVEGRAPFERAEPVAALGAVLTDDAPAPVRAGPLAPVLWHLLAKDPDIRLSADDADRALRQVAACAPSGLGAPPPGAPMPGGPFGGPSSGAPARRWRAGPPLAVAAGVLLVAAAVTVAVRTGGADHPRPRTSAAGSTRAGAGPATSATPSSPSAAGRYVRPFDFCSLLTSAQVARLIPAASKFSADAHSCAWGVAARHRAISVSAEYVYDFAAERAAEDPWTTTPAAARSAYDKQYAVDRRARSGIAWGWDEIDVRRVGARRSAARHVSGVGENAYLTETSQNGTVERADVTLHDSNLYLSIWFVSADGSDATRIRQGALDAARWVSESLRRMR